MWKFVAYIIVLIALWYFFIRPKKVERMTDEDKIGAIIDKVRDIKPELIPVDTVSVDGPSARILYVNTKTYAGELHDATIKEDGNVDVNLTTTRRAQVQDEQNMERL